MDPLVEMQPETWEEIRNLYRQKVPQGLVGVCLLDIQISYPSLRDYIKFNVYCPFGEIKNGFVATLIKNHAYQLSIQPLETLDPIEKALEKTSVIDWNRNIMVPSAGPELIACLQRLQRVLNIKIRYDPKSVAVKYFLAGDSQPLEVTRCAANTYVSGLKPEDVKLLNETWAYQDEYSCYFMQIMMKCGLTWVLYSSENEKPLAWVTVAETGFLTHLYCVEAHRKKGYAEHVLRVAVNDLLTKGINIVAFTLEDNIKPQNLFKKLGFRIIDKSHWVFISKAQSNK